MILDTMEPLMYNALCQMVQTQKCDEILTKEERRQLRRYMGRFDVREDGGLLWDGLKIPTWEQMENVLQPIHYKNMDWHCRDMRVHRQALVDLGFTLPKRLGGLERVCNL